MLTNSATATQACGLTFQKAVETKCRTDHVSIAGKPSGSLFGTSSRAIWASKDNGALWPIFAPALILCTGLPLREALSE
jgi:hypothetical protein